MFISGIKDNRYKGEGHDYIKIEYLKCRDKTRTPEDPPCETEENINKWLRYKYVLPYMINPKIEFTNFSPDPIHQNRIKMPVISLKHGIYSDLDMFYRENVFDRYDHWEPWAKLSTYVFYDTINNEMLINEIPEYNVYTRLGEINIRNMPDKMIHTREVFAFSDWLGEVGGIREMLFFMFTVVIGSFADFH